MTRSKSCEAARAASDIQNPVVRRQRKKVDEVSAVSELRVADFIVVRGEIDAAQIKIGHPTFDTCESLRSQRLVPARSRVNKSQDFGVANAICALSGVIGSDYRDAETQKPT